MDLEVQATMTGEEVLVNTTFFLLNVNGLHKLVYVIFMSTNILRPEMVGDRINVVILWAKYHTVTYVLILTF